MALSVEVFAAVCAVSVLHALWNFAARKCHGNIAVAWLALLLGTLPLVPFLPLTLDPSALSLPAVLLVLGAGIGHGGYMISLNCAYEKGDMSLVYPVARGSGVALTSIVVHFGLHEGTSLLGWIGIWCIVLGVVLVSFQCGAIAPLLCDNLHRDRDKTPDVHVDTQPTRVLPLRVISYEHNPVTPTPSLPLDPPSTPPNVPSSDSDWLHSRTGRALCLALLTGVFICSYSVQGRLGVKEVHPIAFITLIMLVCVVVMAPYVLGRFPQKCRDALRHLKWFIVAVGPPQIVCYLVVLFAFRSTDNTAYVVALRELSVVVGALLGFLLLHEKFTALRGCGIVGIASGIVLLKMA